ATSIEHSPIPLSQRAVLGAYTRSTYWLRMSRKFPGTGEISTPFTQKFFLEPTQWVGSSVWSFATGGRVVKMEGRPAERNTYSTQRDWWWRKKTDDEAKLGLGPSKILNLFERS